MSLYIIDLSGRCVGIEATLGAISKQLGAARPSVSYSDTFASNDRSAAKRVVSAIESAIGARDTYRGIHIAGRIQGRRKE